MRNIRRTIRVPIEEYQRRKTLAERFAEFIAILVGLFCVGAIIFGIMFFLIANIAGGCGQATYYDDGSWETGRCYPEFLFPESKQNVKGRWR